MKATELMIGDWVMYHNHIPMKITQLSPDFDDMDDLNPIPLTTEILKKNGFVNYDEGDLSYRQSCGDIIGIDILGNIAYLEDADLKYVHELQHAFRLCGIKKEIEL